MVMQTVQVIGQNTTLNRNILNRYEPFLNKKEVNFHTASKPYQASQLDKLFSVDSIDQSLNKEVKSDFANRLLNENLLKFEKARLLVTVDPVVTFLSGFETANTITPFESAIGGAVNASFGSNLHFNAIVSQGYSVFPSFLDSIIEKEQVVPGNNYAFKNSNIWSYNNNSGYLSYTPIKYVNLQAGYGRNFIGDGYRSLLLSDNAYSYPFLKITTTIWKLQYVNLFTNFSDIRGSEGNPNAYYNKYGSFHYLSLNVTKRLNIGIFEAVIFENRDTLGQKFTYDINYLNPVIFYRPVEYSIGSGDNVLMGLNFKYKLFNKQLLYGQVIIDEFLLKEIRADVIQAVFPDSSRQSGWWANKYGFQFGYKWFDFLTIKNLQFQGEFNLVRPYSYTHGSINQNYGHYNQPLAHPLGANFKESVVFLRYYLKRFSFEAKMVYVNFGDDTEDIYYGRDIYRSYRNRPYEYGHFIGQGTNTNLLVKDFKVIYLLNPKNNIQMEIGYTGRELRQGQTGGNQKTNFVYAGIRTALFNSYYDR